MTNIDKNPRQITRLRVEDQKNLEKIATKVVYNKDTDTTEIGTNLKVDGYLEAYNDESLTFYQRNNAQTPSMGVSPLFDANKLSFFYNDGQDIDLSIMLDVSVDANILTDENTKTLFGNSLYGTGNIDLYRHQLKVKVGGNAVYFVITSSSNLKVTSLQDLTTVTKATNGYFTLALRPGETNDPLLVTYNNNVWGSSIGAITAITEDVVTPL